MRKLAFRSSNTKKVSFYSLSALLLLAGVMSAFPFAGKASAASFGETYIRFDRLAVSAQTTGTVCVKPTTVLVEATTLVVFPTGYTLGTAGTFTVSTTNLAWPTGGTAWPGINTATNVTTQTVTFPSTDLTVGTLYCFNWTNSAAVKVQTGTGTNNTGSITTQTSAPATIDTSPYSTVSISNDQIAVTASVPTAFTFALSANTDALGVLGTGSVSTSPTPRTATVNTNAQNGWMVLARDASSGLLSPSSSALIGSTTPGTNSTLSAGTEGYNFGATVTQTSGSASPAVTAPFVGSSLGQGGGLDTSMRTVVSSTGTANNAVATFKDNAAIGSTTAAASDYADTVTVVGAAQF